MSSVYKAIYLRKLSGLNGKDGSKSMSIIRTKYKRNTINKNQKTIKILFIKYCKLYNL